MRSLIWFRNDLRITDNTALAAAAARADEGVDAVFIVAMEQWRSHDWGAPKINFMLRQVVSLQESLAKLNIPLSVLHVDRFADAPATLVALAREQRCQGLYFNREYEVNEQARDAAVTSAMMADGVEVFGFHDQTVLPPDELRTGAGQFYRVFTPFKNAWLEAVKARQPIALRAKPRSGRSVAPQGKAERPAGLLEVLHRNPAKESIVAQWPAGEAEARRRLGQFVQNRIARYKDDRDFPSLDGTSSLSPYLSAGVISPRQCLIAAMEANDGQLDSGDRGITTWISELIWREFYRHVLVGFPRICRHQPFRQETRKIQWRDDDAGFEAWCAGRTGVPLVDAAMRQLSATGWMHNRLRMVAAMYLTKDLFIDWHRGERFFMQQLVDADMAQNNGGWQWSASTGTDAAPYFRIFNPVSQSRKFDPRGDFIRQYCPELAGLDEEMIHDPQALPPLVRSRLDYPAPIMDHKTARTRVMEAFGAIK